MKLLALMNNNKMSAVENIKLAVTQYKTAL